MTRLRVLIADDEAIARKRIVRLVSAMPDVELVGECERGDEVLARVNAGGVDVVLLDIDMPGLSGLEAVQLLPPGKAYVIFTTAHPEHAVGAFEVGAMDYVLKPIEAARLQKALARARLAHGTGTGAVPEKPEAALQRIPVQTRTGILLVDPQTISHAVLEDELCSLYTDAGKLLTDFTLSELEEKLPPPRFERVHRRALLNLEHVARLEPLETGGFLARTHGGHAVEISRQSARELRKRLGLSRED